MSNATSAVAPQGSQTSLVIDQGIVPTRTCKKCLASKPVDRFCTFRTRRGEVRRRGTCLDCRGRYAQDNFDRLAEWRRTYNAERRDDRAQRNATRRAGVKRVVDDIKANTPCADCGRRWPPVAMDFDHVGPKSKGIANMVSGAYKLDLILVEIAQCEVVCACCHRIRTASRKENLAPTRAASHVEVLTGGTR